MLCRDGEKLVEFLGRSEPAFVVKIGLVPYFPVFYSHFKAVRPAVIIMIYDMLAYHSPFFIILRGIMP